MMMTRINIQDPDSGTVGWFDPDAAEIFEPDTEWDGHNTIPVTTRDQFRGDRLYRTRGGRWVHEQWSRWEEERDHYSFVDDDEAKVWLVRSQNNDDAIAKYFGAVADEAGPGRPEIGPAISVKMPTELLARVDEAADTQGIPRAEWIRRACVTELEQLARK